MRVRRVAKYTGLVMVRSTDKYDWAISGDVESPSGTNFPKKYVRDSSPEEQSDIVDKVGGRGDRGVAGDGHEDKKNTERNG